MAQSMTLVLPDRRAALTKRLAQVKYNLLERAPEKSGLLQRCADLNVTVVAHSPLSQGLLTGARPSLPGQLQSGAWLSQDLKGGSGKAEKERRTGLRLMPSPLPARVLCTFPWLDEGGCSAEASCRARSGCLSVR